jgi:hypothetical protein
MIIQYATNSAIRRLGPDPFDSKDKRRCLLIGEYEADNCSTLETQANSFSRDLESPGEKQRIDKSMARVRSRWRAADVPKSMPISIIAIEMSVISSLWRRSDLQCS